MEDSPAQRRAKLAAAALLLVEKRLKRGIQSAVNSATHKAQTELYNVAGRREIIAATVAAGAHLQPRIHNAIAAGREEARKTGRDRLVKDLAALGIIIGAADLLFGRANDHERAAYAARSLTHQWKVVAGTAALKASKAGKNVAEAIGATAQDFEWRVTRTASTEASDAFNRERTETMNDLSQDTYRQLGMGVVLGDYLTKVWCAFLDRETCKACAALDGTTIHINQEFEDGDPPKHPGCRCFCMYETAPDFASDAAQ